MQREACPRGLSKGAHPASGAGRQLDMQVIDLGGKGGETIAVTTRKGISAREQAERKRGRNKEEGRGFTPMPKGKM